MATFMPSGDFESVISQARLDVACWRAMQGEAKNARWAEWAGDKLPEMMRDRELAIRSLDSQDIEIRLTAACLFAGYWWASECFAPHVLRVAFEDPAPAVRGAALYALLRVRKHVSDPSGFLRRLLAELFPPPPSDTIAEVSRWLEETKQRVNASKAARWEQLAGCHATRMRENHATAESYLAHPDEQVRCAALSVLRDLWKPDRGFEEACERLIYEDPSVKVRSLALACLACCYSGSDDHRVGRLAAQFVVDDSAPHRLRVAAHLALFTIRGMSTKALLKLCSPRFRFPDDVDWAFVNTFVDRDRANG